MAEKKESEADRHKAISAKAASMKPICPAPVSEKETRSMTRTVLGIEDEADEKKVNVKDREDRRIAAKSEAMDKMEKEREQKEDMPEKMMKKEKSTTEKVLQSKLA